jgi:DNA/RNA-binding domain of Phe-tRNA-synthetase-like protein
MGDAHVETPDVGEVVYAAGHAVRTRRWVWRQASDALVTAGTHDVFFPVDGFGGQTETRVQHAVAQLAAACRDMFGATVASGCVMRDTPTFQPNS